MTQEFYSNGKLLLSGEYVILDGAIGLALPTTYGQSLHIAEHEYPYIKWKSIAPDGFVWFETELDPHDLEIRQSSNLDIARTLQKILKQATKLNHNFLNRSQGYNIETYLNFDRSWGLGSSSTLINNVAQWAQVDGYQLLWNAFSGSGYDIACAQHNSAILYHLKDNQAEVKEIDFNPSFKDCLFFIHLNKKQNSREGIVAYRKREIDTKNLIKQINEITNKMVTCSEINDFEKLLSQHEQILSETIGISTVKSQLFSDYKGAIKSLGAWGGDFILATGDDISTLEYFKSKGYHTIIPFKEMILQKKLL